MILLEAKDVSFNYKGQPTLFEHINLQVSAGQCVAITGDSGCGKSTFCHILSGIIPRSVAGELTGEVLIDGKNIEDMPLCDVIKRVGVVFQNPDAQLFAPTVEDEIAFGPENLCMPREEIERRITASLKTVGMSEHRHSGPARLSGGQKQLVALAAVLALEPNILIFDEAMSQLDTEATQMVKENIVKLKSSGKAIIMVEHDEDNLDIADCVIKM